jgi:hypothetical protein
MSINAKNIDAIKSALNKKAKWVPPETTQRLSSKSATPYSVLQEGMKNAAQAQNSFRDSVGQPLNHKKTVIKALNSKKMPMAKIAVILLTIFGAILAISLQTHV